MLMSDEEIDLGSLEAFLKEHQKLLDHDKTTLVDSRPKNLKDQPKRESHEQVLQNLNTFKEDISSPSFVPFNNQRRDKKMVKNKSLHALVNPREEEKEKLINLLSIPKARPHSFENFKTSDKKPSNKAIAKFAIDPREREKDRLAEIFASSPNKSTKTSRYEICKNLHSDLFFKDNCQANSNAAENSYTSYNSGGQKNINLTCEDSSFINKYSSIPKITVSEFKENHTDSQEGSEQTMVRIGEFSPLNPNLPGGKTALGIGEWDERRKFLIEQQKQEYGKYMQEVSRSQSSGPDINHNCKLRTVATQTEWDNEPQTSPRFSYESPAQAESFATPALRTSPVPPCFQKLSEKELKEYLYREELKQQIEEKNKLKEEIRRKEAEEEAKIEAKIQQDLERMKRQFEEERLQRLELAIKKKEQEEILRQRLAAEQQRAALDNQKKKKPSIRNMSTNVSFDKKSAKSTQSGKFEIPLTKTMPVTSTSVAMSNFHHPQRPLPKQIDVLVERHPSPSELNKHSKTSSDLTEPSAVNKRPSPQVSPPLPVHRSKEVDILAQKAVFLPKTQRKRTVPQYEPSTFSSDVVRDKMKEVENMLRQPLLSESFQVLPPMSPPLLHATIPPLSSSLQRPPSPHASRPIQRTNSEILEDKWKVPYAERDSNDPPDVFTKHNRNVLTQLGAFRRHLQQERLRMQQRVLDETP